MEMIGRYDPNANTDELIVRPEEHGESGEEGSMLEDKLVHYTRKQKLFAIFSLLTTDRWLMSHPKYYKIVSRGLLFPPFPFLTRV